MTQPTTSISGILEEMTIEEVRELKPEVVVLPIGSTEPHGPHLPYGTDTFETEAHCRRAVTAANQSGARVLLYPTLPISNNVNFKAFPFACRIRVRTLMNVVLDIVEALEEDGIRKIVIVNWHGGNPDTLQAAIREHTERHRPGEGAFLCMVGLGSFASRETWQCIEHSSPHAGESETSLMLHLRPDLVRTDKLDNFPINEPVLEPLKNGSVFFVRQWHGLMPESGGGETRASSAEKGKQVMEEVVNGLAQYLTDLSAAQWHPGFPFPMPESSIDL